MLAAVQRRRQRWAAWRDGVFVVCLVLLLVLTAAHLGEYSSCDRPLGVWLVVDFAGVLLFRSVHIFCEWFQASGRASSASARALVAAAARANLLVLFPFLWVWTAVGAVWVLSASRNAAQCVPSAPGLAWICVWMVLNVLFLATYAAVILSVRRLRAQYPQLVSAYDVRDFLVADERARALGLQPQAPAAPGGMEAALRQLGSRPAPPVDDAGRHTDRRCSICLADVPPGHPVRPLPCFHLFHQACLDRWLAVRSTCPNCVRPVWSQVE